MHFLLLVLGILSAIGFWAWRLQMAARGAREVADFAKTVANLPRRLSFLRKSGKTGTDLITDPQDAAAILMVVVSRADHALTDDQRDAIVGTLEAVVRASSSEAAEMLVNAEWMLREDRVPEKTVAKMADIIADAPDIDEADRAAFVRALKDLAHRSAGPAASDLADNVEQRLRRQPH